MVISSSPARSNDQSLVAATCSTTSRGLARDASLKSIRDMPVSTCRFEVGCATTARSPRCLLFSHAVPGGADYSLRGESLVDSNITARFQRLKSYWLEQRLTIGGYRAVIHRLSCELAATDSRG